MVSIESSIIQKFNVNEESLKKFGKDEETESDVESALTSDNDSFYSQDESVIPLDSSCATEESKWLKCEGICNFPPKKVAAVR